ncbi:MAG: tetratricopeptide repeat protein [Anaerolineales bacterium]
MATFAEGPSSSEDAVELMDQAERCYKQGDYAAAREAYEHALGDLLALHGEKHLHTAMAQRGLGVTLFELGEYAAAQGFLERALATRETLLGREHADTAQVLNGLACVRFGQRDIDGGLELVRQALVVREASLGPDHPDTIESLNNLGVFLYHNGDHHRAVEIHGEALTRCERALGDHRSTIETLNALAAKLARDSATYERARELYDRALGMSERVLGATHPLTAVLMNNLAAVLADLERYSDARGLLEQSLALHEQVFGGEHVKTAWVLFNLGDVEWKMEDPASARQHFTHALIVRESALGAQDPATIRTLRKLVAVLGTLVERGDQTALLYSMPLHTCLTAFDAAAGKLPAGQTYLPGAHLDADRAAEQLHDLVGKLGDEMKRAPLTSKAQETLDMAAELERKARQHLDAGEYVEAQELLQRVIEAREQVLGADHLDLVPALKMLEVALQKSDRSSAVLPICQRIADIHVAALGEGHPYSLMALTELAGLMDYEYGPGGGNEIWEKIQRVRESYFGPDDVFTQMTRKTLENLLSFRQGMEAKASPEKPRRSRSEKREGFLRHPNSLVDEILPGLNEVDWRSLQHAYGTAEDVPALLSMLLSEEDDVREDAFEQLFGNIWHQGTVYEASAFAVPFLLRMLADERTPDRLGVLTLLSSLATGSSYLAVHHREGDEMLDLRKLVEKRGEDFDSALKKEMGWVTAANEAVAEGIELFLKLVETEDEDENLRLEALGTISELPTRKSESVPRLLRLFSTTTNRQVRIAVARALHDLMDADRQSLQFFSELLHDGELDVLRLIAAVALIARSRENAPTEAVEEVITALRQLGKSPHHIEATEEERSAWKAVAERYWLLWWDGSPVWFCLESLAGMGGERARTALLQAVSLLRDPDDALRAAGLLLDLTFNCDVSQSAGAAYSRDKQTGVRKIEFWGAPEPALRQIHELSPEQREALRTLVAHDPLWEYQSNLMELYGLPSDRQSLRSQLAAETE